MKKNILAFIFLFLQSGIHAQDCGQYPADCPKSGIEAAQDSDVCIRNFILPEEISMNSKARKAFTALMQKIAGARHWELYEYNEDAGPGYSNSDYSNMKPLAKTLRPPHHYRIAFQFIVNRDSLQAWKDWISNTLQPAATNSVAQFQQAGNSEKMNTAGQYMDSAQYYSNLKAKFLTDNMSQYQDKEKQTLIFRNAVLLRVSFDVNESISLSSGEPRINTVRPLQISGSAVALLLHNDYPDRTTTDDAFQQSTDLAFLLFGKWNLQPDAAHGYTAAYAADRRNTDQASVKKTPGEKIQTITLHIEGRPDYINRFLPLLDVQQLNALITNN